MAFATPDNTTETAVWLNYVRSQATSASLGLIPAHALTMKIRLSNGGWTIGLEYQLTEVTDEDLDDMEEILDEFETLLGVMSVPPDKLEVTSTYEVVETAYADTDTPGQAFGIYARNFRIQPWPPELQQVPITPWGWGEDNPPRRVRRKE